MTHISYWFLLLGLEIYVIYFISGLLIILLTLGMESILKLFKFKSESKAKNILDFFEKNNDKFVRSFICLTIICLVVIPLNNFVYHIRSANQIKHQILFQNKDFIKEKNIKYFYKITGAPTYDSEYFVVYYVYSNKPIEEIQKDKFIKVTKCLYVEPKVILQISKREFLLNTTNRVLKNEQ